MANSPEQRRQNISDHRARWDLKQERKVEIREGNEEAAARRTSIQKLERLDFYGHTAKKERAKLAKKMGADKS